MTAPRGSFILAIETSNPSAGGAGVAVARRTGPGWGALDRSASEPVTPAGRHGDDLMPAIDRVCARVGARPGDLGRIGVSVGPGGYTGLRVAVTVARTLALACGGEVVGVPTALVAREALDAADLPALICLASKGSATSAWLADGAGVRNLGLLEAAGLGEHPVRCIVSDDHLPEPIAQRCARLGVQRRRLTLDPCACLMLAASMEPGGDVAPIYAREPDAVTQWRARHGGAGR